MTPPSNASAPLNCAVLIASCDAYADLWPPFFKLLQHFWPDCPFPIYLGAGDRKSSAPGVTTLFSDGGRDWSRCMQDYLNQIPQIWVLVMLDDFFLRRSVPTSRILHCLAFANSYQAVQVRLVPKPKPTHRIAGESLIGESESGSPYRLSTQAAIWKRTSLLSLLQAGESIWDFEHSGNLRTNAFAGGFYSVWKSALPYEGWFAHHVVEKGLWFPHEKWIFNRRQIGCDFQQRGTLPLPRTLIYHAAQWVDRVLTPLGWRRKAAVKQSLRRVLSPFFSSHLKRLRKPS